MIVQSDDQQGTTLAFANEPARLYFMSDDRSFLENIEIKYDSMIEDGEDLPNEFSRLLTERAL